MAGSYVVTALDGERLDRIAKAIYGTEKGGTVEGLLDANPRILAFGPFLPYGTELIVPDAIETAPETSFQPSWL